MIDKFKHISGLLDNNFAFIQLIFEQILKLDWLKRYDTRYELNPIFALTKVALFPFLLVTCNVVTITNLVDTSNTTLLKDFSLSQFM